MSHQNSSYSLKPTHTRYIAWWTMNTLLFLCTNFGWNGMGIAWASESVSSVKSSIRYTRMCLLFWLSIFVQQQAERILFVYEHRTLPPNSIIKMKFHKKEKRLKMENNKEKEKIIIYNIMKAKSELSHFKRKTMIQCFLYAMYKVSPLMVLM